MYKYVEDKVFLSRAQKSCSEDMKALEVLLREECEINSQFFLVGSGARNLVTQNADESIDFDYNLNILSCPDWNDGEYIKESVRKCLNKVMKKQGLRDVEDSKSTLTSKLVYFKDVPNIEFKIDVCIVAKDTKGLWNRLIHDKHLGRYFWNIAPNSNGYQEKAKLIKSVPGCWEAVRKKYLDRKNYYLRQNNNDHPSFVCYIEAVNDVYNTMKQKRII